jgi:glucosamine kinase
VGTVSFLGATDQPVDQARHVLGIDVGGTKTHLVEARSNDVVREAVISTETWRTSSPERNAEALLGLVKEHLGEAAAKLGVVVGAHGCDSTAQCAALERELARCFPAGARALNDAELMPLAMGASNGIGLVSGTGSIAVARSESGELLTAGGWGWVLGDEGSAAGIVREATRGVLADRDSGNPADALASRLMAAFDVDEPAELAMAVTRTNSASIWGSHAVEVFAAADDGSAVAVRVIADAGAALATLVGQLLARGVPADSVVVGGAVIAAQARLRNAFSAALGQTHPAVRIILLDRAPVMGAIALANRLFATPQATDTATFLPEVTS